MQVLKAQKDLLGDDPYECPRDALLLVSLNEGEEILAEGLEDNANVRRIGSFMQEGVEERDNEVPAWMLRGGGGYLSKYLDLVACCLCIPSG